MISIYWQSKIRAKKKPVTYRRRTLIHFFFKVAPFKWYSVDVKIFGNKRIRPERILGGQREVEISYNKYEWDPTKNIDGTLEISEEDLYRLIDGDNIKIGQTLKKEIVEYLREKNK